MARVSTVQDAGIVFGDWKLYPVDKLNWELCHRREATKGKDAGAVSWRPCGKYYNYHTVGDAVRYASDQVMKEYCEGTTLTLCDAMELHMQVVQRMCDELRASVEAVATATRATE